MNLIVDFCFANVFINATHWDRALIIVAVCSIQIWFAGFILKTKHWLFSTNCTILYYPGQSLLVMDEMGYVSTKIWICAIFIEIQTRPPFYQSHWMFLTGFVRSMKNLNELALSCIWNDIVHYFMTKIWIHKLAPLAYHLANRQDLQCQFDVVISIE